MPYTDTMLAAGERLVIREHQHPFMLIWNGRWAVLALLLAVLMSAFNLFNESTGWFFDLLGWVTLILFVGGLIAIGWGYLRYQNEEYVITTRRLIHAEGVINKKATDSSLEKINDLAITETFFGRMFGFGDLDVLTASETGIERLRMLRNAMEFKKALIEAKHEAELDLTRPTMPPMRTADAAPAAAPVPVPAPAPAPAPEPVAPPPAAMSSEEVTTALDRLADLRDRGIITPEEFEAKKAELLDRL
jgi:membrane protein YdbS with pleckstrin-like domain